MLGSSFPSTSPRNQRSPYRRDRSRAVSLSVGWRSSCYSPDRLPARAAQALPRRRSAVLRVTTAS
jgi:hypothetical protein